MTTLLIIVIAIFIILAIYHPNDPNPLVKVVDSSDHVTVNKTVISLLLNL